MAEIELSAAEVGLVTSAMRALSREFQRNGANRSGIARLLQLADRIEADAARSTCPPADAPSTAVAFDDEWIGPHEVARLLGRSDRQVRRLAEQLGARKVGTCWSFPRAVVEAHRTGVEK